MTAVLLTSCSARNEQLDLMEQYEDRKQALLDLFENQEPVTEPISLYDAVARAIKYNTDQRVKLMEVALARADTRVASMDLLPEMAADAGYVSRSNTKASSRESVETGEQSLETSTSEERSRAIADATMVWNILDFGISYISAKQSSDRVYIAQETRRKTIQNIVQQVRQAYWRAYAAQTLEQDLNSLISDVDDALMSSRYMLDASVNAPLPILTVEDDLLTVRRELASIQEEFVVARSELATLMNVKPGTDFVLKPTTQEMELLEVGVTPADVENIALVMRPELRIEDYQDRIGREDVRKAMLRMLPGIEVEVGAFYDSNDFLLNNSWNIGALRFTWNLFNLFSGPAYKRFAETNAEIDDMRRLALNMAVLAQVHVAFIGYHNARARYGITSDELEVTNRINRNMEHSRSAGQADDFEVIKARSKAILARLRQAQAQADLHNAIGRLAYSAGFDPLPGTVESHDLKTLSTAITRHVSELRQKYLTASHIPRDSSGTRTLVPDEEPRTYPLKEN